MSRGKRSASDRVTERRCIASGNSCDPRDMIRFVVSPENVITPDILGKLPGRGIWVSAQRENLEKAAKKDLFRRAAKADVSLPEDLSALVERRLAAHIVELISLARKSGQAVAGYEKVKSWLEKGEARVLIQASDGSARGKGKLRPPGGNDSLIDVLTSAELGLAFGRENVIHSALATGGLSGRVVEEAARLKGLRKSNGALATGKVKRPDE